jgi:hypothetical protein
LSLDDDPGLTEPGSTRNSNPDPNLMKHNTLEVPDMFRITILSTVVAALILTLTLAPAGQSATEPAAKLRVGVYDSRAIAIAYGNSDYLPAKEMKQKYRAAKEAGDEARVKELEAWGEDHQKKLHFQGFGRVPVTDLLELVKDRIPDVAKAAGVDVIAFECNYTGPNVEVVDVTEELALLFLPSEQALTWLKEIRQVEPLSLTELANMDHDH